MICTQNPGHISIRLVFNYFLLNKSLISSNNRTSALFASGAATGSSAFYILFLAVLIALIIVNIHKANNKKLIKDDTTAP